MSLGFIVLLALNIVYSSAASCPSGFEAHGDSCYFFSHGVETWTGAYDTCKIFGAMLIEVNNDFENNYITNKLVGMSALNPKARWWIGLADKQVENEWMWETSKEIVSNEVYSNWGPAEPNGQNGENCVFYGSTNWGDAACSRLEYYICEIDPSDNEIVG